MKKILSVLYIATLLFASCSDEYDDSALTGRVDNLERDPHHAEWERGWLYDNVQ